MTSCHVCLVLDASLTFTRLCHQLYCRRLWENFLYLTTCLYNGFENELYSFQKKLFAMSFPCVSCSQPVRPRQHALECESCLRWQHRLCNTGNALDCNVVNKKKDNKKEIRYDYRKGDKRYTLNTCIVNYSTFVVLCYIDCITSQEQRNDVQ